MNTKLNAVLNGVAAGHSNVFSVLGVSVISADSKQKSIDVVSEELSLALHKVFYVNL